MNINKEYLLFSIYLLIFIYVSDPAKSQQEPFVPFQQPTQVQEPPVQIQEPPAPVQWPSTEVQQSPVKTQKTKRHLFFFKRNELSEQQSKEKAELLEKQKKERNEIWEKHRQERIEAGKKLQEEKAKEENLNSKVMEIEIKNKQTTLTQIKERENKIMKAERAKNSIQVTTNENDPLYIVNAEVLDSKTNFLKIKNVEFKYKVELQNQTPKIINSVLLIWERKIPFTETLTISKETKISKPIIPYEKRIVEYNDLDSKREGEIYRLKVSKVIFEDGSQWANPAKISYQY